MSHNQLNEYLKLAVDEIRERFGEANLSEFRLLVVCSGRTLSGEAKIEFKLSSDSWGTDPTSGGDLGAVIDEALRREGWKGRNAPLALPRPGTRSESEGELGRAG